MSVPQIVCQMCHAQQDNAWDCVVCGNPLHDRPRHWAVPVEAVEGLEPTRGEDGGPILQERLPDLEPTVLDDGYEPLPDVLIDLEPTAFDAAAIPVAPGTASELEPTALANLPKGAAPAAIVCRYCGTAWQQGGSVFCAGCGMRVTNQSKAAAPGMEGSGGAVCRGCGMPGQALGTLCRSCQQPVHRP